MTEVNCSHIINTKNILQYGNLSKNTECLVDATCQAKSWW